MKRVLEFQSASGATPFASWFDSLPAAVAARVSASLGRMRLGNLGDWKSVGQGVFERRIDFQKGYRVYFGRDGETVIILLGGGSKQRQTRDIRNAQRLWQEYKESKRRGKR